ncbi:MAG TPA: DoxX family membrane protein [Chloroflexia bacterium]|nr:DoxX family membrane protein [Chloroflexia bacterium]
MDATLVTNKKRTLVSDPPIARFLFNDTRSAPLWLALRIWIGLDWFYAGFEKMTGGGWLDSGGKSLMGFWKGAVTIPASGKSPITYTWYADFIKGLLDSGSYSWFAWLIVFGEMAVGLGLIFGCLTAIAAFFGTLMNFSFMLAGSTSSNPMMFALTVFVILAWKNAGWWGLDRFVLPALGTPWQAGKLFSRASSDQPTGSGKTPREVPQS